MKTKLFFLGLFLAAMLLSCSQEEINKDIPADGYLSEQEIGDPLEAPDYRDKYLGNYDFIIEMSSFVLDQGSHDTTFNYFGNITYGTEDDSTILIHYNKNRNIECWVSLDGELTARMDHFGGRFTGDSYVEMGMYVGGHGGGTTTTVTGTKNTTGIEELTL